MKFGQPTYYSRIYRDFEEIRGSSHHSIIGFYERNRKEINYLPLNEQFDLRCEYSDALFETGAYRKHLEVADRIIEESIFHNIKYHLDRDIYEDTLFKKAASHYNLGETDRAVNILKELRKLVPENKDLKLFLYRCFLNDQPTWLKYSRGLFFALALLWMVLFVFEIYSIGMEQASEGIHLKLSNKLLLCLALVILVLGEAVHLVKAYIKTREAS